MEMDLQRPEHIVLLLVVRKPSHHHTELLLRMSRIVIVQDSSSMSLLGEQGSLLDELEFVVLQQIDQTLQERLHAFLFIAHQQQVVPPLVLHVGQFVRQQPRARPHRVEVLEHELSVLDVVQRHALLLHGRQQSALDHQAETGLVQPQHPPLPHLLEPVVGQQRVALGVGAFVAGVRAEVEGVAGRRLAGEGRLGGEQAEGVDALGAPREGLHEVVRLLDGLQLDLGEVDEGLEEDSGREGVEQVDVVELRVQFPQVLPLETLHTSFSNTAQRRLL